MNLPKRVLGNGTVRRARRKSWHVPAVAAIVGGLLACSAYADNTNYNQTPKHSTTCGGACTSAEVDVLFTVIPGNCVPSCTVTAQVRSTTGLCSPIDTIMMHIIDPGDACGYADVAPFPIDLQAGSFVFTNAQFSDWLAGLYTTDVELTAPTVCSSTEDPPGSGIMKVCATAANCDGADTCEASGTLKPPEGPKKKVKGVIPTLSEWGVAVMTILLLSAGTIVFRRQGASAV